MAANYYLELDRQRLLNFANGAKINTFSIPTSSLPLTSSPNPYPPGIVFNDVGPALTFLDAQAWSLIQAYVASAEVLYLLKNNH